MYYSKKLPCNKKETLTEEEKKEIKLEKQKKCEQRRQKNIKRKAQREAKKPQKTKEDVRADILKSLFPERFSELS